MSSTVLWCAMSKIPYNFETPIPRYFRQNGWFENEHMFKFISWAFTRCQTISHKEVKYGREILLQPYEFIAGRLSSPKECFLSENIFRQQINQLVGGGMLVKTTNSLTNKYTCYIWMTERFSEFDNQQNNQQITNRSPTDHHEDRSISSFHEDIQKQEDAQPATPLHKKSDLLTFNFEIWQFEGITPEDRKAWMTMYPHLVLDLEITKATEWIKANPSKSNKKLWRKFLTGWFGRTNDKLENKKAYKSNFPQAGVDRRTRNMDGTPMTSKAEGLF